MSAPEQKPRRTTVSRLAEMLAERRSAASASVNIKGSAQGVAQPDVTVTPDTTREDVKRMTELALWSFEQIMTATAKPEPEPEPKPEPKAEPAGDKPKRGGRATGAKPKGGTQ
jgi:hypothetical protein